jgi:hypothetical protein
MAFIPKFRLYASDGVTLVYTFEAVQYTNAPQDNIRKTVISSPRGQGCIVIQGSTAEWDLIIRGVLLAADYEALVVKMDALVTAIPLGTNFVLKLDKTISTSYSYNVMRIESIAFPESLRTNHQEYTITFKVGTF